MNIGSPTAKRESLPPKAPSLRKEKDDGGPAFPLYWSGKDEKTKKIWQMTDHGMSLRDWFAGMALIDYATMPSDAAAKWAYDRADAMIKERDKGGAA